MQNKEGIELRHYEELEVRFAKWMASRERNIKDRHYVACASGTAALHLAMEALQIKRRSTMLMPDFAMIACARAAVMADLIPSFVDVDDELLIDVSKVPHRITRNVKSILAVHTYGRVCNMKELQSIAYRNNCALIEDCAEAHGAPDTGFYSDAACWSFYHNKIVCGEEGGMVSFANKEVADLARSLRCLGFTEAHDFNHIPRGHNYRMSNTHAFLIIGNLLSADHNLKRRYEIETVMDDIILPHELKLGLRTVCRDVPWVYDIRIPGLKYLNELVMWLRQHHGIAARHGFKSLSMQPEFAKMTENADAFHLGNSRVASNEVLYIPINPWWSNNEAKTQAHALLEGIRVFDSK